MPIEEANELMLMSSEARMSTLKGRNEPKCKDDVIAMLSDQTHDKFRVFQEFGPDDVVKTIAVGKFPIIFP